MSPPSVSAGPPAAEHSDQSLLRRLQTGDQDAAAGLYQRYAQRLHALVKAQCSSELARNLEPEDLVQSVFGAFFQKASEGYYVVPAGEDLWGLLMVITLNKIRSKGAFFAAAKRQGSQQLTADGLDSKQTDEMAGQFLLLVVREALDSLPPIHQSIMELRLQGYEVAEIAERTQRSKRTVERVLQEFRTNLADILREDP